MTIERWNSLKPGDVIQGRLHLAQVVRPSKNAGKGRVKCFDVRYLEGETKEAFMAMTPDNWSVPEPEKLEQLKELDRFIDRLESRATKPDSESGTAVSAVGATGVPPVNSEEPDQGLSPKPVTSMTTAELRREEQEMLPSYDNHTKAEMWRWNDLQQELNHRIHIGPRADPDPVPPEDSEEPGSRAIEPAPRFGVWAAPAPDPEPIDAEIVRFDVCPEPVEPEPEIPRRSVDVGQTPFRGAYGCEFMALPGKFVKAVIGKFACKGVPLLESIGVAHGGVCATDRKRAVVVGEPQADYRPTDLRSALLEAEREELYKDGYDAGAVEEAEGDFPGVGKIVSAVSGYRFLASLDPSFLKDVAAIAVAAGAKSVDLYLGEEQPTPFLGFRFVCEKEAPALGEAFSVPVVGIVVPRQRTVPDQPTIPATEEEDPTQCQ